MGVSKALLNKLHDLSEHGAVCWSENSFPSVCKASADFHCLDMKELGKYILSHNFFV